MTTEDIDRFFAMTEDRDVDFVGSNEHPDVPVLTYRWCRNDPIADCSVEQLVDAGEQGMRRMGLKRVSRHEHHLRGDTATGQRVKMTVLKSGRRSMYLLMTAGMPGTREMAKEINAQLAKEINAQLAKVIEELAGDSKGKV